MVWLDAHVPPSARTRRLNLNTIGDEGGKALGEGLKTNTALTTLKYVTRAAVSPSRLSCRPTPGDGDGSVLTSPFPPEPAVWKPT